MALAVCSAAQAEKVQLQSLTVADMRALYTGAPGTPASIPASLEFPSEKKERYATVVIVHTIGGYVPANEEWFAAALRKAGFATLTYDSFTPRKFGNVAHGNNRAVNSVSIADAFAALKLLAAHPKIDPNKIAVIGFSLGGDTAHLTAVERLRSQYAGGQRFAAHVGFYPGWTSGTVAGPKAYTGAPILLLFGEKDELTSPGKVQPYIAYHKKADPGLPIETHVYPGAHHAWTQPSIAQPRFFPEHGNLRKCPMLLLGTAGGRMLVDGAEKPMDPAAIEKCRNESRGYTMGFNANTRAQSLAATVAFLKRHLQP
jgi:dienelactone hydrolase